jgi:hypothetical protein
MSAELWSMAGLGIMAKATRRMGVRGMLEFTSELFSTSRDWLETTFRSSAIHGLLAPWVLHTGLGHDAATSGFMTALIAVTLELLTASDCAGLGQRFAVTLCRREMDSNPRYREGFYGRELGASQREEAPDLFGRHRL